MSTTRLPGRDSSQIYRDQVTDSSRSGSSILHETDIMPESSPNLLDPLHRYWGYHEFRPKQESIIRSLLAGRDTCVVMPTGGRQVTLLPASGGGFRKNDDSGFYTDRAHAGTAGADG